jgi:FMN phosphatase YigB (HAD superfamily)
VSPSAGGKAILIDIGGVLVPSILPGAALFIDDTRGHVAAAEALGLAGHVHTSAASTMARIRAFLLPEPPAT